jgi:hypothetical protein
MLMAILFLAGIRAYAVTFGEQGTGDASEASTHSVRTVQCICPATGNINRLALYITLAVGEGRVAIYAAAGSNTPGALMTESASQMLVSGWNLFVIPDTAVTHGETYWLACMFSENAAQVAYYENDPYDYRGRVIDIPFGPFIDPFPITSPTYYPHRYCLYATEEIGSPTPSPTNTQTLTPTLTPTVTQTPTPAASLTPTASPIVIPGINQESVIAYPSPARGNTVRFLYYTDGAAKVRIEIYNAFGERGAVLNDDTPEPGYHRIAWDISRTAPGIYIYRIVIEGVRNSGWQKLVIVK